MLWTKKTIVSLFVICRLWIYPFVGTQPTLTSKEKANNNDSKLFFMFSDFCVVLLCVFTFWVPCCDVRYNFHIETMFGSSLPPGLMSYLRYLSLLVLCFWLVFLRLVYVMLPVSLDSPFLTHLAKGNVSFCHHLASVVRRL